MENVEFRRNLVSILRPCKKGFVLIHVEINNPGAYKQDFRFAGIPTENYALQGIKISVFNILSVKQIVQIDLSNKKKMPSCL